MIVNNKGILMAFLSKEKLDFFKSRKKLTNKLIAEKSGINISNVDKIFSGYNKNPNFDTITKIAKVLDCAIDELIEIDEKISPYYTEKELASFAKKIIKNPTLKLLFIKLINMQNKDLELINLFATRLEN